LQHSFPVARGLQEQSGKGPPQEESSEAIDELRSAERLASAVFPIGRQKMKNLQRALLTLAAVAVVSLGGVAASQA
jgi:hypothetical protein